MAMTGVVKDELSRVTVLKPCCRKAEVSTLLRFAGGLHLASGRIVIEAELDTGTTARRLRKDIAEVFGHSSDLVVLATGGPSAASRGRWWPQPPATRRRPGAARFSPTARSPSRAGRCRSR